MESTKFSTLGDFRHARQNSCAKIAAVIAFHPALGFHREHISID